MRRSTNGIGGSTTVRGVRFVRVIYDPAGRDGAGNVNAKRVVIRNDSGRANNLTG